MQVIYTVSLSSAGHRRCGRETPQGVGGSGGMGDCRETLLAGHYPNFPHPSPLFTVWPHCHTLPPHRRHTLSPRCGTPAAHREALSVRGGGGKRTCFREARKKYPELPILTNIDVNPIFLGYKHSLDPFPRKTDRPGAVFAGVPKLVKNVRQHPLRVCACVCVCVCWEGAN